MVKSGKLILAKNEFVLKQYAMLDESLEEAIPRKSLGALQQLLTEHPVCGVMRILVAKEAPALFEYDA